jgi:hypothetical protein
LDQGITGGSSADPKARPSSLNPYLRIAAPIFFSLFFVEYLPLFALGYWSWGYAVHKILSGVFIILNLAIAEYAVRRSRSRAKSDPHGTIGTGTRVNAPSE